MASLNTVKTYFDTLQTKQHGIHYANTGYIALLDGELIDSITYDDNDYTIILASNNLDEEGFINVHDADEEIGTIDIYSNIVSYK